MQGRAALSRVAGHLAKNCDLRIAVALNEAQLSEFILLFVIHTLALPVENFDEAAD